LKTAGPHLKECLARMLLGIYLFMVSAHVVFHPKYPAKNSEISAVNSIANLHRDNSSGNYYIQLHGAFKTVLENKHRTVNHLINIAILFFILIFSGFILPALVKKAGAFLNNSCYTHSHYYLSLCTLRI
jgi:hypothetical protein